MQKIISKVEINELFDQKDIKWELQDVSVLVGKNGVGKSTILHTIYDLLKADDSDAIIQRATSSKLTMADNKSSIEYITNIGIDRNLEKTLRELKESLTTSKNSRSKELSIGIEELINRVNKNLLATQSNIQLSRENSNLGRAPIFGTFKKRGLFRRKDSVNVAFISTSNLNANAINEFKNSAGKRTTILDIEIERELEVFKILSNTEDESRKKLFDEVKKELNKVANEMFAESGKRISLSDALKISCIETKKTIPFEMLSSGERQLLYILLKTANSATTDSVLLMDEPEISLHLSWQSKLITSIAKINKRCQLIIVTHSPAIVMDGWHSALVDVNSITKKNYPKELTIFDIKE